LVIEMTGSDSDIRFGPYVEAYGAEFEDTVRRVASMAKLEALPGCRPRTPIRQVLRMVAEQMQPNFERREAESTP
jgi:UDP-glucose 4-epimerase